MEPSWAILATPAPRETLVQVQGARVEGGVNPSEGEEGGWKNKLSSLRPEEGLQERLKRGGGKKSGPAQRAAAAGRCLAQRGCSAASCLLLLVAASCSSSSLFASSSCSSSSSFASSSSCSSSCWGFLGHRLLGASRDLCPSASPSFSCSSSSIPHPLFTRGDLPEREGGVHEVREREGAQTS